jgi:hypothetical protein
MYGTIFAFGVLLASAATAALADVIKADPDSKVAPAFDIIAADVHSSGEELVFTLSVTGQAGANKPEVTGKFEGSSVYAYVWPTSIDSSAAGFGEKQGILALAVTAHPDFDDTPLYDENGDGKKDNDGAGWHSHWVVLDKDGACRAGLKVKDISPGQEVKLPETAPGVPLLLSSPGHMPELEAAHVTVKVPALSGAATASFDAVASALKVSAEGKAPLLCVTEVFKVLSGDLSLPGKFSAK